MIALMESLSPKPVSSRAVQPATPNAVIRNRRLLRKILRTVTLEVKFKCFQINGIFSSSTRLPALGARGRISCAGQVASSL